MQSKAIQPNYVTGKMYDDGGYIGATVTVAAEHQGSYKVIDTSSPGARNADPQVRTREVIVELGDWPYHALVPKELDDNLIDAALNGDNVKTTKDKNGVPALARLYVPMNGYFEELYIDPRWLTNVTTADPEGKIDYRVWGSTRTTLKVL